MTQTNQLSNREWEVVKLLMQGKSNKLIAASLGISSRTVEFHLKNIYTKFEVSSRIELVLKLGNTAGALESQKLGRSTVDNTKQTAENRDAFNSQMNWTKLLISERYNAMNNNFRNALQNTWKGYTPSVLLIMVASIFFDGARYFTRHQDVKPFIDSLLHHQKDFLEIFLIELLFLTGGYIFIVTVFNPKYMDFARWRSVLAGICATILLAILSIFFQGASLITIMAASILSGMMSALFMLRKASQTTSV